MSKRLTTEQFISKAKIKHNNKYDYSLVNYITKYDKILIVCPEHGEFLQEPRVHMRGCGCSICGNESELKRSKYTETEKKERNRIAVIKSRLKNKKERPAKKGRDIEKRNATYKEYYLKNKEKILRQHSVRRRNRKLEDSLYKLKLSIHRRIYKTIYDKNLTKSKTTEAILGCTYIDFYKYLESKFIDDMSWDNYGRWHLDHIKPISLAKDEDEVYNLNHYTNFQPLWMLDNLKKSNKYGL